MKSVLKVLNKFDICLWVISVVSIILAFTLTGAQDYMTLASSITGVTALMFVSKGHVAGQIITVVFSVLYGVVSYFFKYYGEMITYLGLSLPAAVAATVSWIKNPYKDKSEVAVASLSVKKLLIIFLSATAVTVAFYFVLRALDTTNLVVSTVSVATSFVAAALVFIRNRLYGVAYAVNDVVLIVLWVLATIADIAYLPMIICFTLFFVYDIYGFINWTRMKRRQADSDTIDTDKTDAVQPDAIESEIQSKG